MSRAEIERIMDSVIEAYDPVAERIVNDNAHVIPGFNVTPQQMSENVCKIMRWTEFDLFETQDFQAAYEAEVMPHMLAYAMIACLRRLVFLEATEQGIGLPGFNDRVATESQVWMSKLLEKWNALRKGEKPTHKWIN